MGKPAKAEKPAAETTEAERIADLGKDPVSSGDDRIINDTLTAIQPWYPSLTVEEMRQIFDETYERLTGSSR